MDNTGNYFDVCIIGGSIAGNYLGFLLSQTTLKTVIVEEHTQIGLPVQCAGIISQKIGQLIQIPNNIIKNRVDIAKLVAPCGKYIKLQGEEHPYIIDRAVLDVHFYREAKNHHNVQYLLGEQFKNFKRIKIKGKKRIQVNTSKRSLVTKLLVGCDGPLSLVAEQLGVKNSVLKAFQIRIKADFNQNEAVMIFNPKWKELFGWIVPEGNNLFRVGIASKDNVRSNFNKLLDFLGLNSSDKIDFQAGLIPYGIMNKISYDNILLLGDAAGQAKATTGGGVVMLLNAAKIAFSCIKICFKKQKFSKQVIRKHYEKICKKIIGNSLKFHYILRMMLENFSNSDYLTLFSIVKSSKVEKMLFLYGDMDFPIKVILRLVKNYYILKFLKSFFLKNPKLVFKIISILFNRVLTFDLHNWRSH